MLIIFDDGPDELFVPSADLALKRGVPTEVPDHVAGRAPGDPQPVAEGDVDLDDGRLYERAVDGSWTVRDPGAGLLAQPTFRAYRTAPGTVDLTARVDVAATTKES